MITENQAKVSNLIQRLLELLPNENLSDAVIFGSAAITLNGVDLKIDRGEFVSIIGKSGSGKTTLINMLTGIDRPTKGEIFIGGTPVHRLDESQTATWRGTHLGVVFQFFQLLPALTILENVRLPMDFCDIYPRQERNGRALALLELVGVA